MADITPADFGGLIAAIDPGNEGAIAWLTDRGELVHIEDMPVIEVTSGKSKRKRITPAAIARMFALRRPVHVFLEQVGTRPGEGAVGAFAFGRGFGAIEGVLAGMAIGYTLVRPDVWKRGMRVPADKGQARYRATQMFPAMADKFLRAKDDGRAEAAIIGAWGVQTISVSA